jgi:8-oxo-dGTP diphosphatase
VIRVVAAALIVDGRVLAARRADIGRWEFPGGKVEPDEPEHETLVRECREELAIDVRPRCELAVVADEQIELALWHADLIGALPTASCDHDQLRWLAITDLDTVDWLPLDRALLPSVRRLLAEAQRHQVR